jgi:hypothetical protein
VKVYVPIQQDEQHEKWKTGSKVKVYVNNGQITRAADPLNNTLSEERDMKRWAMCATCCLGVLLCAVLCEAGIRAPGKHCGVVIFDRWDGCTLYSGIYVMYVSERAKEALRKHAGQPVQIDAKEVHQPINPGDGRIGEFEYLGAAPEKRNWVKLKGISLESSVKVGEDGKAIATITVQNKGKEPAKLFSQELALTLLMKRAVSKSSWSVSDGPSFALITRQSFEIGSSSPRWQGKGIAGGKPYSWSIGKENALPHDFTLAPKQKKQIDVQFDLPDGQYDFLCGYGGGVHEGRCLASNLTAFDVEDGKAKPVEVKNR